ncbi:hypothetical protein G8759_02135 [Spirosoma aureum]|uniref:Uncharacterized protein n=1 Tax=Spirosoma aureum TaxID=2692134 RepID=A0A6G9AH47_9BACT|nr:hypothetical protein [Spirosoma aureum]QIP11513.1 hypothetical protein G8759_02135 [Spirosoma aureum]
MEVLSHTLAFLKSAAHSHYSKSYSLWLLLMVHSLVSTGQSQPVQLMNLVLQDKILEKVLKEYQQVSKAKVIAVVIERYDNDYTYTLSDIGLFDSVKRNPTTTYGKWNNTILLFYSGVESVISNLDTNAVNRIQKQLRSILPDQFSDQKVSNDGIIEEKAILFDEIIWRFKVRDRRLLWLRKNLDYQTEKIPYLK